MLGLRGYDFAVDVDKRKALITGVTGQDGSYLAELLLARGYEVHGLIRRSSSFATGRIEHLYHDPHETGAPLTLHYGDLTDASVLVKLINTLRPDEVYNLGAQSHVAVSFEMPEYTADVDAMGTLRLFGGDPVCRRAGPVLSGRQLGNVRAGARGSTAGDDAVLSAQPLRRGQGL